MERSRVRELHYITDIANASSILDHGILSHRLVARRGDAPVVIANPDVQAIRARKRIWLANSSHALHDFANLYVHARNAMLFELLKSHRGDLTVLAVDAPVLDIEGVIIADRNAASRVAKFEPAATGIDQLDEQAVFAEWWNDSDEARQRRMAEVPVPGLVPPELLLRAYVPDSAAAYRLLDQLDGRRLAVRVHPKLFFATRRPR